MWKIQTFQNIAQACITQVCIMVLFLLNTAIQAFNTDDIYGTLLSTL